MDSPVLRKLRNLRAAKDESLITTPEYEAKRKALVENSASEGDSGNKEDTSQPTEGGPDQQSTEPEPSNTDPQTCKDGKVSVQQDKWRSVA